MLTRRELSSVMVAATHASPQIGVRLKNCLFVAAIIAALVLFSTQAHAATAITAVWANNGEDIVTRDEHRATTNPSSVINSVWDGTTIKQFGARNEVVSFNLILEAASASASNIKVTLSNLTGPGGALIRSNPARSPSQLFDWTSTEVELFYIRYLQIKGVSQFMGCGIGQPGYTVAEAYVPAKLRSSTNPPTWASRPNHDKFYPDIAVPLELVPPTKFTITTGNNQAVWADIYIPMTAAIGQYTGTITISEAGVTTHSVPVTLTVRNITLPDLPNAKTMLATGYGDVTPRYTGVSWPAIGSAQDLLGLKVLENQQLVAHRHKISLIGDDGQTGNGAWTASSPSPSYVPYLTGSAFTAAHGYAGPGTGVGNNVFSICTYGGWQSATWPATQAGFWTNTNAWESWFEANSPTTERFLYLIDESSNFTQTEQWANWMKTNPGVGHNLPSMATIPAPNAAAYTPSLTVVTSTGGGIYAEWQNAVDLIKSTPGRKFYMYNGTRPQEGCFLLDDDPSSLRANSWIQYKKGVARWFFWEATYYDDFQTNAGAARQKDLFNNAETFGGPTTSDPSWGQEGYLASNGSGVLFYPGTDALYPASSYGIDGPISSLRLKYWRRGIQDVDYIALAKAINPSAVAAIVSATVPQVAWEVPMADSTGSWYAAGTQVGWSDNPDVWEAQRLALANIIDSGTGNTPPVASAQTITTAEDTAKVITLVASDVDGNALTYAIVATPTHGTLTGSGASRTYTPSANYTGADSFTFKANDGVVDSNTATVSITVTASANQPPVVSAAASVMNPVTGKSANVTATASDDGGEPALIYIWSATGPTAVTFSVNRTNAAKASVATFSKAGSYTLTVTARDVGGLTATRNVSESVNQILTTIGISPATATVTMGSTQQFTSSAKDQFATAMVPQPAMTWTVSGGGAISITGLFTAGSTVGGPFTVTAASGSRSGTASVKVSTSGSGGGGGGGTAGGGGGCGMGSGMGMLLVFLLQSFLVLRRRR